MNPSSSVMPHYGSTMATVPLPCPFPKHVQPCRFVGFSRQTGAHGFACEPWAVQGGGAGSSAVVGSFLQPHIQALKTAGGQYLQAYWDFLSFVPSVPSAAPQTTAVWCWSQAAQAGCDFCTGIPGGGYIQLISIPDGALICSAAHNSSYYQLPYSWSQPFLLHFSVSLLHCWKVLTFVLKYFPLLNQSLCTCLQTH